MNRLIAVAVFSLAAVATSAQSMPLAPLHQPDGVLIQVRQACGAGMHYVQGAGCVRTPAPQRRQVCGWNAYGGRPLRWWRASRSLDLGSPSSPQVDGAQHRYSPDCSRQTERDRQRVCRAFGSRHPSSA